MVLEKLKQRLTFLQRLLPFAQKSESTPNGDGTKPISDNNLSISSADLPLPSDSLPISQDEGLLEDQHELENNPTTTVQEEDVPAHTDLSSAEVLFPPLTRKYIIFSDSDNDVVCINQTLKFLGLLNKKGKLKKRIEGFAIIHTGDLINKRAPNHKTMDYWRALYGDAFLKGGCVKIIGGNHEQEAWQSLIDGSRIGLNKNQELQLKAFVEEMDIIYVDEPLLLIHGYPTIEFLKTLLQYRETTGKLINWFNEDHFRKAFRSLEAINQYAYVKGKMGKNYLLYDVQEAASYYKSNSSELVQLFKELGIRLVIHGHRPQRSGLQTDYEFSRWLPGVRMVGNDICIKKWGIGATIVNIDADGNTVVFLVNIKSNKGKLRKMVKKPV